MTEVEQPPQNGIDLSANEDDDNSKARPADIEQDMREMERRKRVEAIMGSKLFREELERIVDSARDSGNADGILQQLSDIVGVPATRVGSVFRASNCMQPINDIRGVESMGYAKGEKILRCKLAATFRLLDLYGWTQGLGAQITARLKVDQEYFLVNPYGLLYHEITASSLNKVDMQGNIVEQGTTNFGVNKGHFVLHSIVHAARPDIRCIIYIGCSPVVAISSLKAGLLPLTKDACVLGEITSHAYAGCLVDQDEREKLVRNLGPNSKVMLLTNHGALCCGETIEEAFFAACHIVQACETQLKLLPVGLDNLVLIPEESRKTIYEQSRSPPEDLAKKFAAAAAITTAGDSNKAAEEEDKKEGEEKSATTKVLGQTPKWRVGGAEFEALMRMLDNAGYRTGYIYRHPLIKSEPPKPKNDVELPPAVSSLGYLLEEEELFRQGIWKKGVAGKGGDRSRWLNSPNVYQKVEVLETGTPDPKKITKWVAEGSPTHSTPVRIDDPLQFVPVNTNPKEFKRVQQQIKDNRRADKISAGPQSHILEGVTWDEANRLKDATVSQTGDHVVLMGAASKGIIQRGFQHNATVYKAPYAKNPFDNVTDDELNEYKRTVERKKKSIHGEYTDTDFSESEALSSLQTSGAQQQTKQNTTTTTTTAAVSQSEPEDVSEHQVMRIETQQAPVPSQPEVVLSDDNVIANNSRIVQDPICHIQDTIDLTASQSIAITTTTTSSSSDHSRDSDERKFQNLFMKNKNITTPGQHHRHAFDTNSNNSHSNTTTLFHEMQTDVLFNRQKRKQEINHNNTPIAKRHSPGYSDRISPHKIPPHRRSPFTEAPTQPQSTVNNSSDNAFSLYSIKTNETRFDSPSYDYPNLENTSNIYDYTNDVEEDFQKGSIFTLKRSTFLISPKCSSPKICKPILESLDKPSNLQEHYVNAHSPLDLIWNIPIRRHYSPCPTPELANTPRKEKKGFKNSPSRQPRSPYRTLSHFGFNSPQRQPQPEHKHVPPPAAKKYKPLRRSISYEEIFSSVRYIDLCEHCFEQIVRYKPELMHYRIKLRNLREFYQGGGEDGEKEKEETFNLNSNENEDFSVFATPLAPLIEVEERDSSESHRSAKSSSSPTAPHSSFLEKITRMNYSEISSQTTTPQFQMAIHQTLEQEFQNLKIEEEAVDKRDENDNQTRISIMEILDFNNFLGNLDGHENSSEDNLPQELSSSSFTRNCSEDHSRRKLVFEEELWEEHHQVDDTENPGEILSHISAGNGAGDLEEENPNELNAEDHNPRDFENAQQILPHNPNGNCGILGGGDNAQQILPHNPNGNCGILGGGDNKDVNLPHSSSSSSTPRSLMDREERLRRKLIFQELWGEDHVDYFGNLEEGASTLSDNNGAQVGDVRDQEKWSSPRSLMDREERTRRKLIFQELWEDHVEYFGNREELLNATAATYSGNSGGQGGGFSDTESAIDETNNNTQRSSLPNSNENPQEEMFLTQSRVISPKTLGGPRDNDALGNVLTNQELNEKYDEEKHRDDDILSSCSKLTYDISDGHSSSSEENILQRSFGQTNFLRDKQNSTRKEEDIEEGSAKDFNSSPRQDGFQENFVAENANLEGNPEILPNLKKSKIFINDQNAEASSHRAAIDVEAPKSMQYTSEEANNQNLSESNSHEEAKLVEKQMTFHSSKESHDIIENITGPATTPCDNSKFYEFLDENLGNTNVVNLTSQITFFKSNESSDLREEGLNEIGGCNKLKFDESVPPKSFVLDKNENPNLKTQNISAGKGKVQIQEVVIIRPNHDAFKCFEAIEGQDLVNFDSQHNLTSFYQEFPVDEEVFIGKTCETLENKNLCENLDILKEVQPNLENLQNSSFPSTSQNQEGHIETQTQALVRYKSGLLNTLAFEDDASKTENPSPDSEEDFKDILRRIENLQNKDRFSKDKEEGGQDNVAAAGNTQLESSSRPTNFEFPQGNFPAEGDNKENCGAETELSSMEVEILKKIEEHQLKKSEEIFNKIENSIRNKMTPSKLEMLIKEQWLSLYNQDEKTASSCRNILPEIAPTIFSTPQTGGQLSSRRSRSLTPLSDNTIPPKQKLNKTTTPLGDMERRNSLYLTDDNTPQQHKLTPCSSSSSSLKSFKSSSSKTRNFILENIRNVSKPKCGGNVASNQVKRLQGNSQAIFGRNPFGPRPSSSSLKSPRKNATPLAKTPSSQVYCNSTNVYSFQSKLVRGSPRFWVSLTPPPLSCERRRSINKTPRTSKKTQPKKHLPKEKTLSSSSTPPTTTSSSSFTSHVDAEIIALGQQIQQIHPRLENYKRKLDDFGDRVAKCARNMDECISAQEEIVCDHAEFKEAMTMQQYVDEIICRVDTFSLSETED